MTIELELVALGFLLPERILLEQKRELTDDERIEPTQLSPSQGYKLRPHQWETRASVVTLVTQAAEPSLLEM